MPDRSLGEQLMLAAQHGDVDALKRILDQDTDIITYADAEEGVTPLMRAAEEGHAEAVAALLEGGCPWNALDHEGYCAGQ